MPGDARVNQTSLFIRLTPLILSSLASQSLEFLASQAEIWGRKLVFLASFSPRDHRRLQADLDTGEPVCKADKAAKARVELSPNKRDNPIKTITH
jgi:hypothetical protein